MHLQELISHYRLLCVLHTNNGPPFASDELVQFLQCNHIDHITSSPLYPRSTGFIECQVQTIMTALSTTQESCKSPEDLLLDLQSTLIGSNMPSVWEILLNGTFQHPSNPLTPVNMECVHNYLVSQTLVPEAELSHSTQCQKMTYSLTKKCCSCHLKQTSTYPGTIINKATILCSYTIDT